MNALIRRARAHPDLLSLLLLTLIASAFRLINLDANPPGLQGDELFNVIDALNIGREGWPLFFPGNNGREVLFFYPVAFFLALFGKSVFAARLTAALFGIGTVLLGYLIGKAHFSRRAGLAGALLIAVSLWPVLSSRWVLRAVSLSFMSALTILCLTYLLQKRDWRWGIAGGIAFGLTLYTYIPARLFPLVIVSWLIWLALSGSVGRKRLNESWHQILLFLGTGLLTFLPFGIYMATNWAAVNNRVNDFDSALGRALDGDPLALLVPITASLKLFTVLGDLDWRYHLSGRPAFNLVNGSIFYLGTVLALIHIIRRRETKLAGYGLLIIWTLGMLAPNMVVDDKPTFLRFAGGVVPTFLLFGIGFDLLATWLSERKWLSIPTLSLLLGGLVAFTALQTWNDLFTIWPNQQTVREIYQAEQREIALYLNQNSPPERSRVVVAESFVYDAPTVVGFGFYSDQPVDWVSYAGGVLFPNQTANESEVWYFVPHNRTLDSAAEQFLQSAITEQETLLFPNGDEAFTLYKIAGTAASLPDFEPLDQPFENGPRLTGYRPPEEVILGSLADLTLRWEIPDGLPPLANQILQTRVILEDEDGAVWGQDDFLFGFPQAGWTAGDQFLQTLQFEIPSGIPPTPLYFRIELKDSNEQLRAILANPDQRAGPMIAQGEPIKKFEPLAKKQSFGLRDSGPTIHLTNASYSSVTSPGIPMNLAFDWVVEAQPTDDITLRIALIHPETGETVVEQSGVPWQTLFPPSEWVVGTQISTQHKLILDEAYRDPSPLQLEIEWIKPDGESLPLTQAEDDALPTVEVAIRNYLFDLPEISVETAVQFGEAISLLGYDLDESNAKPGGALQLTLYWQALETPSRAYTVFNHIRSAPGADIIAQLDSPPVAEAWATATWLPGEIVIDRREIPISPNVPAGTFPLYIGLYSASDGLRTAVIADGVPQPDEQLYLTDITVD